MEGDTKALQRRIAELEAELSTSKHLVDVLYDSSPDPLLTVDASGVVVGCNRTALVWLRAANADVLGGAFAARFQHDDALALDRLARAGWTAVSERRFALLDGRRASINAAAIEGKRRFQLTVRDVTAQRVLDEAEDQQRRLGAVADLAGAMARELNDPMSIVQGRLELMIELGEDDPTAIERHLQVALEHARRISASLRNLRLVGRSASPEFGCVFLSETFADAIDLVGPRARSVDLRIELDPPELAAGGDAAMYTRVFANLIGHLLDTASRGGPFVIRGRGDDGAVVLTLTGGVIPARAETIAVSAAGLGLSIAHTLLTSVGADLDAQRVGGGILFTVTLPSPPLRRLRARRTEDRLLVVGRAELARRLEALLDMDGFQVAHVADGEAALTLLDGGGVFAAVATDLFLDGMSGLALAEELVRRHPGLRGRVLLLSDTRLASVPATVVSLSSPLRRVALLEALGRRVRRKR
jgi:signal transduction histidine kinase/CheY-like chemotaxis protein